jgi:PAS domain S-box-containing protein
MHTPTVPANTSVLMPAPIRDADWLFAGRDRDLLADIVRGLRQRIGLDDAIRPLLDFRARAIEQNPDRAAEVVELCNDLLLRALSVRYDAMDRAVRDMSTPYAELDRTGVIIFANRAFLAIAPESLARPFAGLFDSRAGDEVEAAVTAGEATSLLLDMSVAGSRFAQVRVVIGPLADDSGVNGAFALLIDTGGDDRLYNSSPDGILRVSASSRITFVNQRACDLLGVTQDRLIGSSASAIFRSGSLGEKTTRDFAAWSAGNEGKKVRATFTRFGTEDRVPVRASILPTFHNRERRAGTLIAFSPTTAESARRKLQKLLSTPCTPGDLALGTLGAIRSVVPYDLATWGVYTPDMKFFRVLATHPHRAWPVRWWPVREYWLEWLRSGKTWTPDLQKVVDKNDPETSREPVFQEIQQKGLKNLLTVTIGGGNGKYRSAVTLLSIDHTYDQSHFDTIRGLGARDAFNAVEVSFKRLRDDRLRDLKGHLFNDQDPKSLAEQFAAGIADCFGWEFVTIYQVNRATERFELIAQHDTTDGKCLTIECTYVQPFDVGILHTVLMSGAREVVPEINENTPPSTFYRLSDHMRSAMAKPIKIGDEIQWIVEAESTERNAFEGPDMADFDSLMEEWQEALSERWHGHLQRALLAAADQALLVVDRLGAIRLCNPRAEDLFQLSEHELTTRNLADFGIATTFAALQSASSLSPELKTPELKTLRIGPDLTVSVLVTGRPLYDDYDHRLFLLTDVRNTDWEQNWRYLDNTVKEVARHVRVPLMIAQSLVNEASEEAEPAAARGLLNHAMKQMMKADITFERLSDTLSAHQPPEHPRHRFEVMHLLRESIRGFPPDDAECIAVDGRDVRFEVFGWPDRLAFVLRSLLEHLLALRSSKGAIEIVASLDATQSLHLTLQLRNTKAREPAADDRSDASAEAQRRACEMATLALTTLQSVVKRHDGDLVREMNLGIPLFRIVLRPPAGRS